MSRPVFLADHNVETVCILTVLDLEPSITFARLRDFSLHDADDDSVLAFAAIQGMVLVSRDRETMPAFAEARITRGLPMSGLLLIRPRSSSMLIARDIALIWTVTEPIYWIDRTEWIPL